MMKTNDKPVSRQTLYQIASGHSKRAIERLVELMESGNENVAMGACRVLLNKTIPDLKSQEIKEEISIIDNEPRTDEEKIKQIKDLIVRMIQVGSETFGSDMINSLQEENKNLSS